MSTLAYAYESGYQDGLKAADTEKAALERRIDELCAEVERLRQIADGAANEADRLTHDAAALQIENAKLRELVIDFDKCLDTAVYLAGVNGFATMPSQELFDSLRPRMQELGVVL